MPLSPALATWPAQQGHDAVHAGDLGLHRAADEMIIARAKQEGRSVITADLDDPRLLALAQATEPGLVPFRNGRWSEADAVARMSEVLSALSEAEIADSIVIVEQSSLRRRRLPIGH